MIPPEQSTDRWWPVKKSPSPQTGLCGFCHELAVQYNDEIAFLCTLVVRPYAPQYGCVFLYKHRSDPRCRGPPSCEFFARKIHNERRKTAWMDTIRIRLIRARSAGKTRTTPIPFLPQVTYPLLHWSRERPADALYRASGTAAYH